MKIDFHAHVWNTQLDQVGEFAERLTALGTDAAVVLPIAPYMTNESIADLVKAASGKVIGFASVVPFAETTGIPREDPLTTLGHAVETLGLRGLKLHPLIQGFALNDPGLVPVVSAAGDLGVPVLVHTGPANGRAGRLQNGEINLLDDLAIMCPNTVLIAGHANPLSDAPYLARKHKNVYLETSISWARWGKLIPGLVRQVIEDAGPDKILYGTDFSLGRDQRVTDTNAVIDATGLPDADLALVYGGNAARLLNLS
ncbi:amidohydrolase family protein [Phytohabitans sp. ZYX-F-186]|uniref:Amidohydrolase family protein n=1 Tax=Phytohabitans maris TaxID=3071409 RepID=A0ABU0Z929_9ACTN|nr:amidohydrolase family protein [Phytohabitans sp. ZYX-F-186]MDQ7903559.1 amidohydrolase family protein [Phytohabitans sp. ZYX-F-186]